MNRRQGYLNKLLYVCSSLEWLGVEKTASNDDAQMGIGIGIGLVLFWPTLFFLDGKGGLEAAEYARLKGEADALEEASIHKNCGYKFDSMPKPKTTATTTTVQKTTFKE